MSPSRLLSLAAVLLLSACADTMTDPLTAPPATSRGISDAVHGEDGNPHFFWLPPVAAQPAGRLLGRFEQLASPRVVVVCQETNQGVADCDGHVGEGFPAVVAEFDLGSGLLLEDDHFKVELDTRAFGLRLSSDDGASYSTYRILVYTDPLSDFGGPFVLGHADFRVGESGRAAKNLSTGDAIGLADGRTLPVRFRIDQGAYAHALGVNLARAVGDPDDGELCQENCSVTLIDPAETTVASLDDEAGLMVTAIQFQPGDLPETAVLVIDERITDGEDANCATGVQVDKRYCYRYRIIPDVEEFNNPVRFGICPRELPINDDLAWRIHKVDYRNGVPVLTYPEEVDVSDFLPCTDAGGTAFLGRALRYASHWLVTPLFAQTTVRAWGGMVRDLSDLFWGRAIDDDRPFDTWLLVEPADPVTLCWPGGDACQPSVALSAEATGASGTYANPWTRVHFYYRPGTGSHAPTLIGEATNPSVHENASVMVYTWSVALNSEGLPAGELDVFAIGVDAGGNAYQTPFNSNVTVVAPLTAMVTSWNTSLGAGTTVTLALAGTVDATIDWGDGTTTPVTTAGPHTHDYGVDGIYTVFVTGTVTAYSSLHHGGVESERHKLVSVDAWGDLGLNSLTTAFQGASNLVSVPGHSEGIEAVTEMSGMFRDATSFDQNIGDWDVSNVTNMASMFRDAASFNGDIGRWDTSGVLFMQGMFYGASAFDQDIGGWDVSNVLNMRLMFSLAGSFNPDISGWNTSTVKDMSYMFQGAASFNHDIGSWETWMVEDMEAMFAGASAFNQDLSGWCVSRIPTRPQGFDDGATNWVLPRPVWGTCPAQSFADIDAATIADMEAGGLLSTGPIDSSDGNDFWPGTYFVYRTSEGRFGKFIVEQYEPDEHHLLTIQWMTYNADGSVYTSGSGLVIRGTWDCDLDEGIETEVGADFWWRMHTATTRSLTPLNGAKFSLVHRP
jgi:surface protein